ncbi:hypothetical protein Tco_1344396 [Tanacetum coccineum]
MWNEVHTPFQGTTKDLEKLYLEYDEKKLLRFDTFGRGGRKGKVGLRSDRYVMLRNRNGKHETRHCCDLKKILETIEATKGDAQRCRAMALRNKIQELLNSDPWRDSRLADHVNKRGCGQLDPKRYQVDIRSMMVIGSRLNSWSVGYETVERGS